jgi:hypothetical protein
VTAPCSPEACHHCGRPRNGYGSIGGQVVCHPSGTSGPDCYRRVLIYREPLGRLKGVDPLPSGVSGFRDEMYVPELRLRILNQLATGRPLADWQDHVGGGWRDLLRRMNADLTEIDPLYQVLGVGTADGALAVGVRPGARPGGQADLTERMARVVARYEEESRGTCESCGLPGIRKSDPPDLAVRTLCGACRAAPPPRADPPGPDDERNGGFEL